MTIQQRYSRHPTLDHIWYSVLYDKTDELSKKGLKLNKFPHPSTCLSQSCMLNIITSQCYRFHRANSTPANFLNSAAQLYAKFIGKGYDKITLDQKFKAFLTRHRPSLQLRSDAVTARYQYLVEADKTYKSQQHQSRL